MYKERSKNGMMLITKSSGSSGLKFQIGTIQTKSYMRGNECLEGNIIKIKKL